MQKKPKKQESKFDLAKFTFRYDNVLVKAVKAEATNGLVNPTQYDDKPEFGEVIAVGEGRVLENGQVLPPKVKAGDIVFFGKYSSEGTRVQGTDYFLIKEEDIKAVL